MGSASSLHTADCLAYAKATGSGYCIVQCRDDRRRREEEELFAAAAEGSSRGRARARKDEKEEAAGVVDGVRLAKAAPTAGVAVDPVRLLIVDELPDFDGAEWMAEARDFYRDQARRLVAALVAALPGGTLDAVLLALLERRAGVRRTADGEREAITGEDAVRPPQEG